MFLQAPYASLIVLLINRVSEGHHSAVITQVYFTNTVSVSQIHSSKLPNILIIC